MIRLGDFDAGQLDLHGQPANDIKSLGRQRAARVETGLRGDGTLPEPPCGDDGEGHQPTEGGSA